MTRPRGSPSVYGWFLMAVLACSHGDDSAMHEPAAPTADDDAAAAAATTRQPRHDMVAALRSDLDARRHPSDGGGRAWLDSQDGPPRATASQAGRWTIIYEAGSLGIAEGGSVFLQVSPFWGWSTPQVDRPQAPGFTEVTTTAAGVELRSRTLDQQLLGITLAGRGLRPGERLRMVYGAGSAAALADRFAERGSRFWIAVDGDGDGVRQVLVDSPTVDVAPGPASRLVLLLPSTARPGQKIRLALSVLDARGNAGVDFAGRLELSAAASVTEPLTESITGLPPYIDFDGSEGGHRTIELSAPPAGNVRVAARGPGDLVGESNPLQVTARGLPVWWADLQNHSNLSDGSATPEDLLTYAREVAALDVVALTDHDHWGMLFLDQHPEMWAEIRRLTESFHQPGRFVTLLGFEWTNWIYGHRHVLYFSDQGEVLSALDPAYETPELLWAALAGQRAITVAHHSAGGPISTDWSIAPEPRLEPVTEIVSVHGASEAADAPLLIHRPVAGNFVRDALDRGYRFGFLGSSDGHDGHPGLGHLASPSGGVAAILSDELTRDAVYEALMARRVYATNGPRILLRTSFAGYRMGAEVPVGSSGDAVAGIPDDTLVVQVIAPGKLRHLDIIRSGRVSDRLDCGGEREVSFGLAIDDLSVGETLYVRVVQEDDGAAWSSPFYFVDRDSSSS